MNMICYLINLSPNVSTMRNSDFIVMVPIKLQGTNGGLFYPTVSSSFLFPPFSLLLLLFLFQTETHAPIWSEIHCVAKAGLDFLILLPQPLKC